MDVERLKAELESKRKTGAVVSRLGGFRGIASMLTGNGVPRQVRAIVEEAFAADGFTRFHLVNQKRGEIGPLFASYSDADWRRVTETLVPQFAPAIDSAGRVLANRPYQEGMTRQPYRCPRSAATLADTRGRWLLRITLLIGEYDADIRWVAERGAHLAGWSGAADLGWLLAGAIDVGGETGREVYEILTASALGEHEVGQMGRHVTQALMSCARPDAWEFVERLLLSAQRQEGLRQAILEAVDESHPHAFRRMLRLILDENLTRFSSVVRAADTWFGFMWDGSSGLKIDSIIERVLLFLDDPSARAAALQDKDAETVYLALWSTAFEDIDGAIPQASALLASPATPIRFVASHFLVQSLWTDAVPPLVDMLADPELSVASRALDMFGADMTKQVDGERLFDRLEQLMGRLSARSQVVESPVWPWWTRKLEKPRIAAALAANASTVAGERLLPHVPYLQPSDRATFVRRIAGLPPARERKPNATRKTNFSSAERTVLLELLGDTSADVRAAAFDVMRGLTLEGDEVDRLVVLLERKPGDLRNACLTRLRTLPDAALLAVADRLLADPSEARRVAGLELLRDAAEAGRVVAAARERVERYTATSATVADQAKAHVTAILGEQSDKATTDDALGLVDVSARRVWPEPRLRGVELDTSGARASLKALAEVVLEHQETEVQLPSGETKLLVESAGWGFGPRKMEDSEEKGLAVPLATVWRSWVESRPSALRDPDGLELLRALVGERDVGPWKSTPVKQVVGLGQWQAGGRFLTGILEWCAVWDPPRDAMTFLADGLERSIAAITPDDYRVIRARAQDGVPFVHFMLGGTRKDEPLQRKLMAAQDWLNRLRWWRDLFPSSIQPTQAERLYGMLRCFEERSAGSNALRITVAEFVGAYRARTVDEAEFIDLIVGRWSTRAHSLLREVSTRKPPRLLAEHPELLAVVDRCRRRVVEVESQRGDRESAASRLAMELRATGGLDTLARALPALGKSKFARQFGWSASGSARQETLSHLVLRSVPRDDDTPEAFAQWVRDAKIAQPRLVELAVYAPQWAAHVNCVLEWPGLESAVWWIQAHTKDDRSWQLSELKELWAAEVSERTPLSAADLTEGAVDVAWFRSAYDTLGTARWKMVDTAAKYAASAGGHTRAQLFARAMAGLVTAGELLQRINASRHQDSVRALGLLPLADGALGRADLLERYKRLQEFHREARTFGSQRQQSERRAVSIGLANLARTAGFRDPQRLQWAMEQEAVADLARGPLVLTRGDVSLALSLDEEGRPSLVTTKNGKALKAIPASLKKDPDVAELKDRLQELKRQRSRVRDALEAAMCRGDKFGTSELRVLFDHPVLAPSLAKLVFVGDDVAGYPAEGGRALRDHAGTMHVLGNGEEVRIAHPYDLFTRGDWSSWQRDCFAAERVQPFKQLFRELYPLTGQERDLTSSRRYAGHQVNPRQALALLAARGWVARPDEGVSRTFHDEGMTVRLAFQESFMTPAEIEGLTIEDVVFTPKGEWKELALSSVPPALFSEAMRDLDLVVSVAHRGGVDPEATASTTEMRAALVRETSALLGLENVEVLANHVIVRGTRGTYSVHLGSGNVMLMPGTAIPIVAVHSQHRGRLFLPFADDDPRTAEVLSKVLLLARDRDIRDPTILEWIRAAQHGRMS